MELGGARGVRKTFVSTFSINIIKPASPQRVVRRLESGPSVSMSAVQRSAEHRHASTDTSPKRGGTTEQAGGRPVFQDPPDQVEVRVGEEAVLRCVFSSDRAPVASCWIHNAEKVVVSCPRTAVRSGETESQVTLSPVSQDDEGAYTLVVRNRRGVAKHTVQLSVIDRPGPPASRPFISWLSSSSPSSSSSSSLHLSWVGPAHDGGSPLTGYVVEVGPGDPQDPGDWTELSGICKDASLRVLAGSGLCKDASLRVLAGSGLCTDASLRVLAGSWPLAGRRFRVRAVNAAGVSEPSEASEPVRMDATGGRAEDDSPATVTVDTATVDTVTVAAVTVDTTHKVRDHYNVHEELGRGGFADVYRLTHKQTGRVCAGKFYKSRLSRARLAARREIELMAALRHPRLVQCYGAYAVRRDTVMVMEYIAGGDLFERIAVDGFEHTEPGCSRYMLQVLDGLRYVHTHNIVHLDLKPENIVCVDHTGTSVKIIDFGLAHKLEPNLTVLQGTPEFVSPEVIAFEPVGLKSDMWSIGVIAYILLGGDSPFLGSDTASTLAQVTVARYAFDEDVFRDVSDHAKDLIRALLQKDMRRRLSSDEALAHPWLASFSVNQNQQPAKRLSKDRLKLFLTRRRWKKNAIAVMAVKRFALLTNRTGPDSPVSPGTEDVWGPEVTLALRSLEQQLQAEPHFQQSLEDLSLPRGATARMACLLQGHPDPEVQWLVGGAPVEESSRMSVERGEDGRCALVLSELGPQDSGVYTCRATNELGGAECSAQLGVE